MERTQLRKKSILERKRETRGSNNWQIVNSGHSYKKVIQIGRISLFLHVGIIIAAGALSPSLHNSFFVDRLPPFHAPVLPSASQDSSLTDNAEYVAGRPYPTLHPHEHLLTNPGYPRGPRMKPMTVSALSMLHQRRDHRRPNWERPW